MTDAAELERVRFIHRELDRAAASPENHTNGVRLSWHRDEVARYTADEIRAWPSIKKALISEAVRYPRFNSVWIEGSAHLFLTEKLDHGDSCTAPAVARGFCLYREMLNDGERKWDKFAKFAKTYDKLADKLDAALEHQRQLNKSDPYAAERTAPYGANDDTHEAAVAALTQAMPTNEAARLRNVAALSLEMRKPVEARYPAEGRSERVYGGRRW